MDVKPILKKRNFEQLIKSSESDQPTMAYEQQLFERKGLTKANKPDKKEESVGEKKRIFSRAPLNSNIEMHVKSSVLINYFKILRGWKWLIALCTLGFVIPTAIWVWQVTPIYETEATIIYEEANDTAFLLEFGQPLYSKSAILNMVEQIKSRALADEVAKRLPDEIARTFRLPDRRGENFSREQYIAGVINNSLEVQNVRGADIIKIRIHANDPQAAKAVADMYVDLIGDMNLLKKKKEISNIRNFIDGQISIVQEKLRNAEEDLLAFKEKNDLVQLSDTSSEMLSNLTDAEVAYNQAKTEREALEQRRRFIEQKKQELIPSLATTNNETTQRLKGELANLEKQSTNLQGRGGAMDQEALASLKEKIDQKKQTFVNEMMKSGVRENLADPLSQIRNLLQESITLEVELETYKAREQGLRTTMNDYSRQLQSLPKQELALARFIRAKEVNDKIYAILLEKREEARITEAGKVGDVRVVDYAQTPSSPIKPRKAKTLTMAIALGLSFGIGLAFLLSSLDNSLKTEQDVEKYLAWPVIASIPKIANTWVLPKIVKKEEPDDSRYSILLSQNPSKSYIFEAYRSLQLNLSFLNPDKNLKMILITSSAPREGKTITSLNIAQFYAREGTKTLVMDCDLRRPMVHKAFKIIPEPGLTNLFIDKSMKLNSAVHIFEQDLFAANLSILPCGTLPPNPSKLLTSKRMEDILAQAYDTYDLIIIDTPPVISVTDAIILGKKVDGVLLVVRSGQTSCEAALKAKKILDHSELNVIGTLLNDVDVKSAYGYYKGLYYYSDKQERKVLRPRGAEANLVNVTTIERFNHKNDTLLN